MRTVISGLDSWQEEGPVAAGPHPLAVGELHPLGAAGRSPGVADQMRIVDINGDVRVGIRLRGHPRIIIVAPNNHVFEVVERILKLRDLMRVFRRDDYRSAIGVTDHVRVSLRGIAAIEWHTHKIADRSG